MGKVYGDHVAWGKTLPNRGKPHVPVLQPKPGKRLRMLILDERVTQVVVHWHADGIGHGRSLPCAAPDRPCTGCGAKLPFREKAYLACLDMDTRKPCLVCLTPAALTACPQIEDKAKSLRGLELLVWRVGKRDNSPMACSVFVPDMRPGVVLPVIDTKDVLLRMWAGDSASNASVARKAHFDPSEVPND